LKVRGWRGARGQAVKRPGPLQVEHPDRGARVRRGEAADCTVDVAAGVAAAEAGVARARSTGVLSIAPAPTAAAAARKDRFRVLKVISSF